MGEPRALGRLLVVDDEADMSELLRYYLEIEGHEVCVASRGAEAITLLHETKPELMLLDVMLPDISGIEICRRVRALTHIPQPAVIMVTARGEEIDRVVGFEVGADDYVVKPFSMRELSLRIRTILQRSRARTTSADDRSESSGARRCLTAGPLKVDVDGHHVLLMGQELHLSVLEMRLLVHLLTHGGRVCTREALLAEVWGYQPGVTTRTVDTHVKRLRDKLGPAGELIETVRGSGYRVAGELAVENGAVTP